MALKLFPVVSKSAQIYSAAEEEFGGRREERFAAEQLRGVVMAARR